MPRRLRPLCLRLALSALAAAAAGCTVPALELEGKACDDAHACVEGYTCVENKCLKEVPGGGKDAGTDKPDGGGADAGADAGLDGGVGECTPDAKEPCGPPQEVGLCKKGQRTCGKDGRWGECEGEVMPSDETCNGEDDDCDGDTDKDDSDLKMPPCPLQKGVCEGARQDCVLGKPVACDEMVYFAHDILYEEGAELSCDAVDNNCDGRVDEAMDEDQDGWGLPGVDACEKGTGDCDDNSAQTFPGSSTGLRRVIGGEGAADRPVVRSLGEAQGFRLAYVEGEAAAARIVMRRITKTGALLAARPLDGSAEGLQSLALGSSHLASVRATGTSSAAATAAVILGDGFNGTVTLGASAPHAVAVGDLAEGKSVVAVSRNPVGRLWLATLDGKATVSSQDYPATGSIEEPTFGTLGSALALYYKSGTTLAGTLLDPDGKPTGETVLAIANPGTPVEPSAAPDVLAFKLDCQAPCYPKIALAHLSADTGLVVDDVVTFPVAANTSVDRPSAAYLGNQTWLVGWEEFAGALTFRLGKVTWDSGAKKWGTPALLDAVHEDGWSTLHRSLAAHPSGVHLVSFSAMDGTSSDVFFRFYCP